MNELIVDYDYVNDYGIILDAPAQREYERCWDDNTPYDRRHGPGRSDWLLAHNSATNLPSKLRELKEREYWNGRSTSYYDLALEMQKSTKKPFIDPTAYLLKRPCPEAVLLDAEYIGSWRSLSVYNAQVWRPTENSHVGWLCLESFVLDPTYVGVYYRWHYAPGGLNQGRGRVVGRYVGTFTDLLGVRYTVNPVAWPCPIHHMVEDEYNRFFDQHGWPAFESYKFQSDARPHHDNFYHVEVGAALEKGHVIPRIVLQQFNHHWIRRFKTLEKVNPLHPLVREWLDQQEEK